MDSSLLSSLLSSLSIGAGLFLGVAATTAGAADAPARTLDWGRATAVPALAAPAQPAFGGLPPPRPVEKKVAVPAAAASSGKGLFALEDRAIIIVGGKSTTAGAVKQELQDQIAAKAGAPKVVKGGARALDATTRADSTAVGTTPLRQYVGVPPPGLGNSPRTSATATAAPIQAAQGGRIGVTPTLSTGKETASLATLRCPDKGPPKIVESPGRLKAGGSAVVWGQCFGDRPGRVELIGQFPGGKLTLAFKAWDQNSIELEVPASVRGAPDHPVAVTVVTADGRTSPAMQAQFVAARERVEVPDHAWQPGAGFELASTNVDSANPAAEGRIDRSVHVNPQCALESMDAVVLAGGITGITGFDKGPPHEAQVKIDWVGTCINTSTTTRYTSIVALGDDYSFKSACKVAFQARAWAYCPAGVAP